MKGNVDVGYQINHKLKYKLRMGNYQIIVGGYECTFEKRAKMVYRAKTDVKGFFIRKQNWKMMEYNFPEFFEQLKLKFFIIYTNKILRYISECK